MENRMTTRPRSDAAQATAAAAALDRAVRAAAGASGAVVVDYVAASRDGAGSAVELAIEFFVPPTSKDQFGETLKNELNGGSGTAEPLTPIVHALPPGTLHQWRIAWRQTEAFQRAHRWAANRALLDSVLHQADHGFREIHHV